MAGIGDRVGVAVGMLVGCIGVEREESDVGRVGIVVSSSVAWLEASVCRGFAVVVVAHMLVVVGGC